MDLVIIILLINLDNNKQKNIFITDNLLPLFYFILFNL